MKNILTSRLNSTRGMRARLSSNVTSASGRKLTLNNFGYISFIFPYVLPFSLVTYLLGMQEKFCTWVYLCCDRMDSKEQRTRHKDESQR